MIQRAKSFREKHAPSAHYIINQAPQPVFGPIAGGLIASCLSILVGVAASIATLYAAEQLKSKELLRSEALKVAAGTIGDLNKCRSAILKFRDGADGNNDTYKTALEKYLTDMDECQAALMVRYFDVRRYFDDDMAAMLIKPDDPIRSSPFKAEDIFEMYDSTGRLIMVRHNMLSEAKHERPVEGPFDQTRSTTLAYELGGTIGEHLALIERNTVTVMKGFDDRLTLLGHPRVKFISSGK